MRFLFAISFVSVVSGSTAFADGTTGKLIQIPFCEELSGRVPDGWGMRQLNGSDCGNGWACFASWSMRPSSGQPSTIDWHQTVTAYHVEREDCVCGPGNAKGCGIATDPSYLVIAMPLQRPKEPLLQVTGEVLTNGSAQIQGAVSYSFQWQNLFIPSLRPSSFELALQRRQGSSWIDVTVVPIEPCNGCGKQSVAANAWVPENSQIRMELRGAGPNIAPGLPDWMYPRLQVYDAYFFGAQCFPSPDPSSLMCSD